MKLNLLTIGNPKTLKGEAKGYLTFILHLAPGELSGHQVCPGATAGCLLACLNKAGRGGIMAHGQSTNVIQTARIRRTKLFFSDRVQFMAMLVSDIVKAIAHAERLGLVAVFRLNGTSDIAWEKIRTASHRSIMAQFPGVQFYDYTKVHGRRTPDNYALTYSRAESNGEQALAHLLDGGRVAVVFEDELPAEWNGFPVVNGDEHDLIFLQPTGHVLGLKAKGPAKKDTSGFVVRRTIR